MNSMAMYGTHECGRAAVVRIVCYIFAVPRPRAPAVAPQLPPANRFLLSPAETVVLLVFPMVFKGSWLTVAFSATRPRAPAVASQLPAAIRFLLSPAETVVLLVLPMVFDVSQSIVSFPLIVSLALPRTLTNAC